MLVSATKYQDVRSAAASRRSNGVGASRADRERPGAHVPSPGPRRSSTPVAPAILVRQPKAGSLEEWMYRELREGGRIHEYLRAEKVLAEKRWRRIRRAMEGVRQNNRSDWRLIAAIPPRDFHRWQQTDPDFWRDDANLRSLRRSNPDMPIYV